MGLTEEYPATLQQPPKNRWIRGYSVTTYPRNHFDTPYPRIHEVNIIYNSYCVSVYRRIHLDVYLSFAKPMKVEKRIEGITAYPRIQLF